MCLAEFATTFTYTYKSKTDDECIENYVHGVSGHEDNIDSNTIIK